MGDWLKRVCWVALSSYVTTGFSAGLGLLVVSGSMYLLFGQFAASVASVGAIICIPPDHASPRKGKLLHILPAALLGLPLFLAIQILQADPLLTGLLLVPATFFTFLAGAWGQRGVPIVISIMFAMIFSLAVPRHLHTTSVLTLSLYFGTGSLVYLSYAVLSNAALNHRYRAQLLAQSILSLSSLMRLQADRFDSATATPSSGRIMQQQAALANQLQSARDLVLESPRTKHRQKLAAMLINVIEIRDHLLASELDLELIKPDLSASPALAAIRILIYQLALALDAQADALLWGRRPKALADLRSELAMLNEPGTRTDEPLGSTPPFSSLMRGLTDRVAYINDEIMRLNQLARNEVEPDLTAVRTAWKVFVSPTSWSLRPFLMLWHWDAPPLRHAIRAALAIGTGYLVSITLPWGTHGYWILMTIVVVLRGSFSQTVERRNSRVAGTLLGCFLAGGILVAQTPPLLLLLIVPLAQAIAHAFAIRRYLVTAVAATVLSLVQAHLISSVDAPVFNALERIGDTLLGVGIAWAFSYVLPSWERNQIPSLVNRALQAQARHAQVTLSLGQLQAVDDEPELTWRLARREAYDSLSALVLASRRSVSEPRAVRPAIDAIESLLTHAYQLLAQLAAIKTMLLVHRDDGGDIQEALQLTAVNIGDILSEGVAATMPDSLQKNLSIAGSEPYDAFADELKPWILRRLSLASDIALLIKTDADAVLLQQKGSLAAPSQ